MLRPRGIRQQQRKTNHSTVFGFAQYSEAISVPGLKVTDVDCDFRVFRRRVLEAIELTETDGTMCIELLKKLQDGGFRFVEAPVGHYPRVYGRSQYFTFKGVLHSYAQLFRLWMRLVVRKRHLEPSIAPLASVPAQDE